MMNNKAVIYARVSSIGDRQSTDRQVADLTAYAAAAGLDVVRVFEEKASGAKKDREVLTECLELLKRGEAQHLLVTELSRLGRNLRQVLGIVEDLTDAGVNIYFQSQGMNTMKADGTPDEMVKAMVSMFGAFAEIERKQIADRLHSGRQHAIEAGTAKLGRPTGTGLSDEEILKKYPEIARRLRKGDRIRDIATLCGVSTKTVQKVKKSMKI